MFKYRAFALTIDSDFRLPGFLPGTGEADVVIRRKPLPKPMPEQLAEGDETIIYSDAGHCIVGRAAKNVRFIVRDGDTIWLDDGEARDAGLVRSLLQGVVLATLLRQRGYLVLHACCVAKGGRAVGFLGESGWGKSTLAGYLGQNGFDVLSDDIMVIDVQPNVPVAVPGFPQIRLRPDAGRALHDDFDRLPQVHDATRKRRYEEWSGFREEVVPLDALYVLSPISADACRVEPMTPQAALVEVVRHTRVTNLIRKASLRAEHLQQCARLIDRVSVCRLHRVLGLERLDEIRRAIEAHLCTPAEPVRDG